MVDACRSLFLFSRSPWEISLKDWNNTECRMAERIWNIDERLEGLVANVMLE
jgi:hypothetical protein